MTNLSGYPMKMIFAPGKEHDLSVFKVLDPMKLPKGSTRYGDEAYNDYEYEDQMLEKGIQISVDRKKNSKRS